MKPILPKRTPTVKCLEDAKNIPRIIAPPGITILLIPSDFSKNNLVIRNIRIDPANTSILSKASRNCDKEKDQREINSSSTFDNVYKEEHQLPHQNNASKRLPVFTKDIKTTCNKVILEVQNIDKHSDDHRISLDKSASCEFQKNLSISGETQDQEEIFYESISKTFEVNSTNSENCVSVSSENIKIDVCVNSPPSYESHVSNTSKVLIHIEENGKITNEFLSENIPVPPSYSHTSHESNESLFLSPDAVPSNRLEPSENIIYPNDSFQYDSHQLENYSNTESTNDLNNVSYQSTSSLVKSFESESKLPNNILNYNYNYVKDNKLHESTSYEENAWYYSHNDDQPRDYSYNSVLNSAQKPEAEKIDLIESFMENALNQVIFNSENESSYEERRTFAKNLLSIQGNETERKKALQENFWIVEDEPLEESIFMKAAETKEDSSSAPKLRSLKSKPSKNFICHICGKTLKGRSSLRPHINLHMNIKPYECKYCSKKFTQSSILKNHVRIHTGETPYSCNICGKAFKTLSILRRHSSQHSQLRPYQCCVCPKAFKNKVDLQCHLKVHTSGPHMCTYCKTLFDTRKSLSTHIQRKHKSEKKHFCSICNQGYLSQTVLQQHMNIHSNKPKHTCHVCGATYTWRSGLASHMRTHAFKIQCEICGVKFTSLKKHEKHRSRHAEPAPHKCSKCERQFKYSSLLKKHISKHKDELFCHECNIGFIYKTQMKKHLKMHSHKQN